jgi:hypothetical protein
MTVVDYWDRLFRDQVGKEQQRTRQRKSGKA